MLTQNKQHKIITKLPKKPDKIYTKLKNFAYIRYYCGGARGVMIIIVGNGHGDMSSNPGIG